MRKVLLLLVAIGLVLFTSCKNEASELIQSTSSDGEMVIDVQGKRGSSFDPYHVDVVLNFKGEKINSFVEVYAEAITKDNVSFTWKDSRHCVVTFVQRDNTSVSVPISIEE